MTKNQTKKKNAKMTVAEAGAKGGAIRARDVDGMRQAQRKGQAALSSRFKTPEEKAAYFRGLGEKGKAAQAAKKAKKDTHS